MTKEKLDPLLKKYTRVKSRLKLNERYFQIFEYRNGLQDGVRHTLADTGQKFGVTGTRIRQLEERVKYEVEMQK